MCTRYALEKDLPELKDIIDAASRSRLVQKFIDSYARPFITYGEVRPTDIAPVIATSKRGNKACFPMQWGFNVAKRPVLPNARLETAADTPLFQAAWEAV